MNFLCNQHMTTHSAILKEDNEILQTSSEESDVKFFKKDWSRIHWPLLEHIYSFLNRTDQFNMSLVCKNWLAGYESPHIWRHFNFYLPEYVCSCHICPGTKFPRKFGNFYRHVEIIFKRVQGHLINDIFAQLKTFLCCITNYSQLHSIRFIDMNKYFMQLDDEDYSELFQITEDFFKNQNNLKLVEFRDSLFLREEGARILKVVCKYSTRTLETLILKGFVTDSIEIEGQEIDDFELYSSLKEHIMNLTTLRTDYTQLLENVIMAVSNEPENIDARYRLSLIEIGCNGDKRHRFQGIFSEAWRSLKRSCPNLKVHMTITSTCHPRFDYSFFIVPHIPIQFLEYCILTPLESRDVNIEELFMHIIACGCHDHLEDLTIVWMPLVGDLSSSLIPFLQLTKKLRKLHIDLRFPVYGIEDFMQWLTEKHVCLKSVHISVAQVKKEDNFNDIADLAIAYSPRLQDLGLSVSLIAYAI